MNDRTLRRVVVGLGGRPNGYPRETGFDITAASEVMAVMAIARDLKELRRRLGAITVAHRYDGGGPVTAEDLGAAGAMTVLLSDALKPNLIQTLEGQPCLMHCGPFANIDHGNNSLVADLIAMKLGDYVVTECGFGSDMGMKKFVDIVCRLGGLMPSAAVLVRTVRAIKRHGGVAHNRPPDHGDGPRAIEIGMANVRRHLGIVRELGVPCVVAVNRRPEDAAQDVELVRSLALEEGAVRPRSTRASRREASVQRISPVPSSTREQPNTFGQLYPITRPSARRSRPSRSGSTAPGTCSCTPRRSEASTSSSVMGWDISRSAWRRPISRSLPIRRWPTHRRTSPSRCAASGPAPEPVGWSRCAAISSRCPDLAGPRRR
jgi:formyltetrahydrofolate synthetase